SVRGSLILLRFRLVLWSLPGYFFGGGASLPGVGAGAPAAGAAAPSAGCSCSLAFFAFLTVTRWTRTFGSPNGLRPSCQRSSRCKVRMRSPRVSTFRARCSWFLRRKLLSIDMAFPRRQTIDHTDCHDTARSHGGQEHLASVITVRGRSRRRGWAGALPRAWGHVPIATREAARRARSRRSSSRPGRFASRRRPSHWIRKKSIGPP